MTTYELKGHERPVNAIKLNYDGDLFFSGGSDALINVWSVKDGERLGSFKQKGAVRCLDVDDDSKYLITGTQIGYIHIFNVSNGELIKILEDEKSKIKFLELSYGSKDLIVLREYYDITVAPKATVYHNIFTKIEEYKEQKIQLESIEPTLRITLGNFTFNQIRWGFLNKHFFACTESGELIKYNSKGDVEIQKKVHPGDIKQISFSKDFSFLATAGIDGCKFFNPENLDTIRYFKQQLPMNTVSISPLITIQKNEKEQKYHCLMAGGIPSRESARVKIGGYEVRLCNLMYGQEISNIQLHFGPCNMILFLHDGRGFITAGEDGYCKLVRFDNSYWDLE